MAQKDAQWLHLAPLLLWWPAVKSKVRQRAAQEHSLSLVQLTRGACYHANSPPQPLGGVQWSVFQPLGVPMVQHRTNRKGGRCLNCMQIIYCAS
jgi:hypothetical protein